MNHPSLIDAIMKSVEQDVELTFRRGFRESEILVEGRGGYYQNMEPGSSNLRVGAVRLMDRSMMDMARQTNEGALAHATLWVLEEIARIRSGVKPADGS